MTVGRKVWGSVLGDLESGFIPSGVFPDSGKVKFVWAGWWPRSMALIRSIFGAAHDRADSKD